MVWNESVNGDLSNNGLAPTQLTFASGTNTVIGTVGDAGTGTGIDRDYFSFVVPTGTVLTSIVLRNETSVSGSASFLGLEQGPQMTVTPSGGNIQDFLGYLHYDASLVGTDLLPTITSAGKLSSGTYTVWVQETGGQVPYGFDFNVTPVPLPGAALLLFGGLLGLGTLRGSRRRTA
jgi:hypothetical protein